MRNSFLVVLLLGIASCNSNLVFSDYQTMNDGKWEVDKPAHFEVEGLDTTQTYNMFINIRNDDVFPYNNLFLIAELEHPDGNTQKDTLEYRMAEPTGEWLGKGLGSIKENKLWYKEKIVFPDSGVYKVSIIHAMRQNGNVEGVQILDGITDVGLEIEKSTQ
ncbi:gliding motility lipoprotein GldH [Muricauda sp. JGD-17]|uniref:Gliding motility lipoprotein GldH n=1 Tax=Flagellimonas ochracea TaxID=2696472 RepID=A0A964TCD0_9FLAO|nr:gliding motility lipoprotein GldH [Allomuricauda ochracea]NAY91581.1 gliding motility lipoprotein GldH [Allomuricauda ochracea]